MTRERVRHDDGSQVGDEAIAPREELMWSSMLTRIKSFICMGRDRSVGSYRLSGGGIAVRSDDVVAMWCSR